MNVFVLSTGRCGSTTIARAFAHASNFTAGHETQAGSFYSLAYPDWHVESDNRLSWLLGGLAARYPSARYVHLIREREGMARSFERRVDYAGASIRGFGAGILGRGDAFPSERYEAACRMHDAVNENITCFLEQREHRVVWLHQLEQRFTGLWEWLGCEGDLVGALAETRVRHNAG